MFANLVKSFLFVACSVTQVDRLEARTDWLAAQRAGGTISLIADLLRRRDRLETADIELYQQLKSFADV